MYILQVLNNNVLLVEDKNRNEKIIWGRGIGFRKSQGQNYRVKSTDKIFASIPNHDEKWLTAFNELSLKIPREYFELTESIIESAKKDIDSEFDDNLLIPLTDHIYFAVKRYKIGMYIPNPMIFEIKRYFSDEYEVAKRVGRMIYDLSGVQFDDSEFGFIAIHLIEHEIGKSNGSVRNFDQLMQIIDTVINIIQSDLKITVSKDNPSLNRLISHLNFLLIRKKGYNSDTNLKENMKLQDLFTENYPNVAEAVSNIISYLTDLIDYTFTENDKLYLMIHVLQLIE